jgi:hypothetical protein
MDSKTVVIYPTAVSWWLWIPIYTLIIGQGIFLMNETSPWFLVFHIVLAVAIFFWVRSIRYTLSEESLEIYMGLGMKRKIPLASIRKVALSNNPISSPAASLQRIAIHYDRWGYILISPKNREAFIEELEKRREALAGQSQP